MKAFTDPDELIALRRTLHQNPELSGFENKTVKGLINYLRKYKPDKIITQIGGNSFAAVYKGNKPGPTILFRADMDALPIEEKNKIEYRSINKNAAHLCGHDGHMVMLSGMAQVLNQIRPVKGKIVLFYQAEEETGQGAEKAVNDQKFIDLNVDYIFGMHNIPGYEKGSIILSNDIFSSASSGLILRLKGKSSHAGEPENGINPAKAVADLIYEFENIYKSEFVKDFALITIIMIKLGERAFGTNPGNAEIMSTFRSYRNDDMEYLSDEALKTIKSTCNKYSLKYDYEWVEEFPALINHNQFVDLIRDLAQKEELKIIEKNLPFKWSEDFSHYMLNYKGCFWGIGAGKKSPQLHNPNYDFPDDIIGKGIQLFQSIYKYFLL